MKKIISYVIIAILIPTVVIGGAYIFKDKQSAWITLSVTLLSCVPFFISFEKGEHSAKRLILIAAMVALSVVGRLVFSPVPGFKPVTAMVVVSAMYFGSEAGFMTGALAAVISDFAFGQGPWTPFQMLSWGLIGLFAGLLSEQMKKNRVVLAVYAAASGVIYSLLMDVWTVLGADDFFNISRYIAAIVTSAPFTAVYAVSNLIFLLLLAKPIGKVLDRISTKYDIG